MSNILEFPSREKQAYAYLTDQLGSLLRDKGADDVLIAHATELLTKVYGDLQGDSDFSFSVSLPNGLDIDEVQQLQEKLARASRRCATPPLDHDSHGRAAIAHRIRIIPAKPGLAPSS